MEYIISVDEYDNELGPIEKMEAHTQGVLHRAFSIFVFNSRKQLLLQRRNIQKYHSGGLWTNTCCSHPRYGEILEDAIYRRLKEEMGFICDLKEILEFTYKVRFENNLIEHEYDHVFIGYYEGQIVPDEKEVEAYKWMDMEDITTDMMENPDSYTYWFREVYSKVVEYLDKEVV